MIHKDTSNIKVKIGLVFLLWLLLIGVSFGWNLHQARMARSQIAIETARAFFQQILLTRRWNARHGGIYVPITAQTQPNPYLKVADRDLRISDTLTLTKVNPAYMTRQLAELAKEENNIQFHITSRMPVRPENYADDWETIALLAFENGIKDIGEFIGTSDMQRYRYMAVLMTEKPCLQCHAEQGYQLGDVRGGISITLPYVMPLPWRSLTITHAGLAIVGGLLILIMGNLLKRSYNQLRQQAAFDALTSIPNRRYFIENLIEEFRRGRRERTPLSLVICDIDNFKSYNDNFGHQAGDGCLRTVAQTLSDNLQRGGDFCARYGGEEFVVVLPNTSINNAVQVAEKMREAVANLNMCHPASTFGIVTISMGVAMDDVRNPDHETLIRHADGALYRAKETGRNRVEAHYPTLTTVQPHQRPKSRHSKRHHHH
ncbi:diguanylate cyclase [Thiospirillum jenense]|uniref:diguanylate cyclase n=1 Tax=Thiospirillum jenense TaxID=1653858 RepID=A0A839HD47_9GAMM|nr:diguanylate cyclase [Thiospirillum jenense]MBB1125178.1 diguanylate cyclase [Thiospirillum jenense]